MRLVTVEVKNENAFKLLQDLEINKIIKIIPSENNSIVQEGSPLSIQQFNNWIKESEIQPTITLDDYKSKWQLKKEQLTRATK